jgi:uncharacterized protein (UPF0276 family)
MTPDVGIGLVLHAETSYLDLVRPLLSELDYVEVTPETLWSWRPDGALAPNGFHARILRMGRDAGLPFVAHGIGLSLAAVDPDDGARQARWLDRIRADHRAFGFHWYTEHLGATMLGGVHVALPCPVPMTLQHARAARNRLADLRDVVGIAGLENTAHHFCLGDPLDEPAFLAAAIDAPRLHLLLDLHNVHAMAANLGFDARAYLDRLPLERVIEIHLAGGGESDPAWLPSRRRFVLDGHDRRIPEAVWSLLDQVLGRCPGLRGVTIERLDGTLEHDDVDVLAGEIGRARRTVRGTRHTRGDREPPVAGRLPREDHDGSFERAYGSALCARDPVAAIGRIVADRDRPDGLRRSLGAADPDGIRLTGLLIAKLRFQRVVNGSRDATRWFMRDGAGFTAAFLAYHRAELPRDHAPTSEAIRFHAWCRRWALG